MHIKIASGVIDLGNGSKLTISYPEANRAEVVNTLHGKTYPRLALPEEVRVVVDVGANVGISAIFWAMTYPEASVIAFEPHKETFGLAEANTAGFDHVRVFNFGLDEKDRRVDLYLGNYTSSTNSLFTGALWNSNETASIYLRDAQQVLRDLEIQEIDILKVDTEGCELPILRSILQTHTPKIIHFEYHSETDRRALDELLRPNYGAILGTIRRLHLGTLTYARNDIAPLLEEGKYAPIGPS